jgi:uncharacterized repeat protein (TIGR01451 family)
MLVAVSSVAAPQRLASAAGTCAYDLATQRVNITITSGTSSTLQVSDGTVAGTVDGDFLFDGAPCGGSPNNGNTASVNVVTAASATAEAFVIDNTFGAPDREFSSSIAWFVDLGQGTGDFLQVIGADQTDNVFVFGNTSFTMNGASGTTAGLEIVQAIGQGGNDTLDGSALGTGVQLIGHSGGGVDLVAPGAFLTDVVNGGGQVGDTLSYSTRMTSTSVGSPAGIAGFDSNANCALAAPEETDAFAGFDTYQTGTGNDCLVGTGGSETFIPGDGDDDITGGGGVDTLDYSSSSAAMVIDPALGTATGQGSDEFTSVEAFIGSAFDDTLFWDGSTSFFSGGPGRDTVSAEASSTGQSILLDELDPEPDDLECAIGGPDDDELVGNDLNNSIWAGSGVDNVFGQAGDDVLSTRDDEGGDSIDGGPGINICMIDPGDTGSNCQPSAEDSQFSCQVGADLQIDKRDLTDPVDLGGDLAYSLFVTNVGPDAAEGVEVEDLLPTGVKFVSVASTIGTCSAGTLIRCTLGTLPAGGSATISIHVIPTVPGLLTNTATVSSTEPRDPNLANNTDTETTEVAAADLAISKGAVPDPVRVGHRLTYTLTIGNAGPSIASAVSVTDPLPVSAAFVSVSVTAGSCVGTSTVTCSLGDMLPGATATITIVVRPTLGGTLTNAASVNAAGPPDPDLENNADTTSTEVFSRDITIEKTVYPATASVGGQVEFRLNVTNGPHPARDVTVIDELPANVSFVSATTSQGVCSGRRTVTCDLGDLPPHGTASVTITVTVDAPGRIENIATVEGPGIDPNPANNEDDATVVVARKEPKLALLLTVGPPGVVTLAQGSGFPADIEVTLDWDEGIGTLTVTTDEDGEFSTWIFIFRGDVMGPRTLVATGLGFAEVTAPFLVAPGTAQPPDFVNRS